MTWRALFLFNVLRLVLLAHGIDTGHFIFPVDNTVNNLKNNDYVHNPVFSVGETIDIKFDTNSTLTGIRIWQIKGDNISDYIYEELPNAWGISQRHYTWITIGVDGTNGQPSFDLIRSNIFQFCLYNTVDRPPLAYSILFNITNSTVDARGNIISTTASASSTALVNTLAWTTSSGPTTTPSPVLSTSSGSNSGARIGTGAGVGVGVGLPLLICTVAGLLWWRRKRDNTGSESDQQVGGIYVQNAETRASQLQAAPESSLDRYSELSNTHPPMELPAAPQIIERE